MQDKGLLRIDDFVQTIEADGTTVYSHTETKDAIRIETGVSPLLIFSKIREFSEKHGLRMSPEVEKLSDYVRSYVERGLERHGITLDEHISKFDDEAFEDEFNREIFGDDDDDWFLGERLRRRR